MTGYSTRPSASLSARPPAPIGRRAFLGASVLGAGAASGADAARAANTAEIRGYRRLGRTGLSVSDISLGTSRTTDPDVIRYAVERGVNFIDSAESYRFGNAEEAIGEALGGQRDKVYLTSKTKARDNDRAAEMMEALEGSLRRLRTDYVDIYFNHAVNDVDRMRNAEWHEFTERAKRDGKIRFRGVSGHGSRLAEVLAYSIDNDLCDVILCAHNFGQDPAFLDKLRRTVHYVALQQALPPVLTRAREKDVGILGMKVLMGARLNDMKPHERGGASFSQAALRWTLSAGYADAAVITMSRREHVDEYLRASGDHVVGAEDQRLLELYAALQAKHYCRHGCNACEGVCPAGVEIAEVLRTRMYAVDYRDSALALQDYAALGQGASACLSCDGAPCAGACPHELPIAHFTRDAASRLTA